MHQSSARFALKILLILSILPRISLAQQFPGNAFDRVKLTLDDRVILANLSTVSDFPVAKATLTYFWYRANAIFTTQGGYSGKLLNGEYTEYYLNKNLKEQGHFEHGLKSGSWKSWYDNGHLQSIYTWKDGIKTGDFFVYDDAGILTQTGKYKNNLLKGNVTAYISPDSTHTVKYRQGKILPPKPKDTTSFWHRINLLNKIFIKKDSSKNVDLLEKRKKDKNASEHL